MSPSIVVSSATFIYIRSVVVLMYFIVEERIESFETKIGASDWLKLSEKWCARTSAFLAAAQRIRMDGYDRNPSNILHDCKKPKTL
jgi:hypothetical protein